ncbi:MAG: GIY-YIG nuclease family protein [Bacteroidales bacterium]|nr:GIY-YIG nuclease family protein [Bacteroidales bacterium]
MGVNIRDTLLDYINLQQREFDKAYNSIEMLNDFKSFSINTNEVLDFAKYHFRNILYYIEINDSTISNSTIIEKILTQKKTNKNPKFPKVNIENNGVLYVGKSSGDFANRLRQHYGSSESTYALHFNKWEEIFKRPIKLKLHYLHFGDDIPINTLEIIESSLHLKLKPILGRSGH